MGLVVDRLRFIPNVNLELILAYRNTFQAALTIGIFNRQYILKSNTITQLQQEERDVQ